MQTYFSILILTLIGGVTAYLARDRGRDPIFWFVIGILFSIFGLITLLILPDHSAAISDSKEPKVSSKGITSIQTETSLFENRDVESVLVSDQWFYMDCEWKVVGPLLLVELADRWNRGVIPIETYVWNPSLKDWASPYMIEGLISFLNKFSKNS